MITVQAQRIYLYVMAAEVDTLFCQSDSVLRHPFRRLNDPVPIAGRGKSSVGLVVPVWERFVRRSQTGLPSGVNWGRSRQAYRDQPSVILSHSLGYRLRQFLIRRCLVIQRAMGLYMAHSHGFRLRESRRCRNRVLHERLGVVARIGHCPGAKPLQVRPARARPHSRPLRFRRAAAVGAS
jgi:hypothetical protein